MQPVRALIIVTAAVFGMAQITGCASSPSDRAAGQVFDDGLITAKVKRALFRQEGVSILDVEVNTYRGEVQLSGFVPDAEAKRLAEEAARRVEGVKDVKNDIRVNAEALQAPASNR
jgi:osmotically-inducible protein OsmY